MAEELRAERGKLPEASKKSEFARDLFMAKKRAELNPAVYAERYALLFVRFLEIAFVLSNLVLCYFQANCRILEQSNSMHWKAYVSSHMLSKGPSLCAEGSDSIKSLQRFRHA